jgi:hypothetical protein
MPHDGPSLVDPIKINDAVSLESEFASQFEMQIVRRPFQTRTSALIVDDEEVAVGPIDVNSLLLNSYSAEDVSRFNIYRRL